MSKFIIFLLLFSSFLFPSSVSAKVIYQEKGMVTVGQKEVIDDDLFVGAENFDLLGTVIGSVYVGAGSASIAGNIKGDLVMGTGNADISGIIGGDIYLGAGDVTIHSATIGGSIIAGAGTLTLDDKTKVAGSLIAASGNLKNSASIDRNLLAGAGTIYINNQVGKEARVGGGSIELGPLAKIKGDLTYALGEESDNLTQDPSATIDGTTSRYTPPLNQQEITTSKEDMRKLGMFASRGWLIISFFGYLIIAVVLLKVFGKTIQKLAKVGTEKTWSAMGTGFLISLCIVPLVLIVAITGIGLQLAGLLIGVMTVALPIAKIVTSFVLGMFIAKQFNWHKLGVYATAFVGLFIFYILKSLPVFGWLASLSFTWIGLGCIWLYARSNQKFL